MKYPIELTTTARRDLQMFVTWFSKRSRVDANRWHRRLLAKIQTLDHNPQRCPLAEDADAFSVPDVRQLLFGRRPNVYRVLYAIRDDSVVVLRVMHAAQRFLNEPGDSDD